MQWYMPHYPTALLHVIRALMGTNFFYGNLGCMGGTDSMTGSGGLGGLAGLGECLGLCELDCSHERCLGVGIGRLDRTVATSMACWRSLAATACASDTAAATARATASSMAACACACAAAATASATSAAAAVEPPPQRAAAAPRRFLGRASAARDDAAPARARSAPGSRRGWPHAHAGAPPRQPQRARARGTPLRALRSKLALERVQRGRASMEMAA
jgi:hypothetical protein